MCVGIAAAYACFNCRFLSLPVVEREEVEETVTRLGGVYAKDLSRAASHLIATSMDTAKVTFAKQWNIPVVSRQWMHDSLVLNGIAVMTCVICF